jgi:glucose-1-phosphate thymidylyltransferase
VPLSSRGERELPQAVALAAGEGVAFEVIPVRARVLDLSRRADVAGVAADLAGRTVRL